MMLLNETAIRKIAIFTLLYLFIYKFIYGDVGYI